VQGTRPNAVSAFRTFVEYILCAYTRMNRITFTYYATSIPRSDLRVVLRVTGEPTLTLSKISIIIETIGGLDDARDFEELFLSVGNHVYLSAYNGTSP